MDSSDSEPSDTSYFIIKSPAQAEIKIKGSHFIAQAIPVKSPHECEQKLLQHQKTYHDATHICYAFRTGIGDKTIYHYSDAGEPAGSAGLPIFKVIAGAGLTNILLVVIRYFGGTKLGIGGLVRAYTEAAKSALERSQIIRKEITETIIFRVEYDYLNPVLRELSVQRCKILAQSYSDTILFRVAAPAQHVNLIRENLINLTSGKVVFLTGEKGDLAC